MPQEVIHTGAPWHLSSATVIRLLGIGLLGVLIVRLDLTRVWDVLRTANVALILLAVVGVFPLIWVKTVRWQGILRAQAVRLAIWPALLAYFGSLFIGFLTPGRLGEFIKAIHVNRDCDISLTQAFSSVLADRLFDLYALLVVGSAGLLTLALEDAETFVLAGLVLLLTIPLALFLNNTGFSWLQRIGKRLGSPGRKLFSADGVLVGMRAGLCCLTFKWVLWAVILTVLAYGIFFGQCYLLARSLNLEVGFIPMMFAVACGSLITLVPISISGIGTREAAMIAYLNSAGVSAEAALSFSLLVFVTFYVAGGLIGALAWWIKPIPFTRSQDA